MNVFFKENVRVLCEIYEYKIKVKLDIYTIYSKRNAALGYNISFCFGSPSKTIEYLSKEK
jgi:hypothetical protein